MNQPNPWIQFMGGIALLNVSMLVGGVHAPAWARYAGMAACIALGLTGMGLGLRNYFRKKPERPKIMPRKRTPRPAQPARTRGDAGAMESSDH